MYFKVFALCVIFFALKFNKIECRFEFTNIKCNALDESFVKFDYCYIKSINRTYKYISIKATTFVRPINEAVTNWEMLRRNNGYFPFLYNITGPVCPFFENRKRYPVASFITESFLKYTNFNHKCPFDQNVFMLDKLDIGFLDNRYTKYLPFPDGNYAINGSFFVDEICRANVQVFFTLG